MSDNPSWIQPPPQKRMGCFGRGCLILLVFALVLILACCAGLYWGYRHHSAVPRGGIFLAKAGAITNSPRPVPQYSAAPQEEVRAVKSRLENFENAVRQREPAEIELTADEINSLIAANRHARGKAFVSIEGNRLSVQTSVPLNKFFGQSGYYLSGDITIQSDAAASLRNPRLASVAVNSRPVPHDLLDWKYGSRSLRDYLAEYSPIQDVGTIQIRDGKVILRSRGE